MALDMTDLKTIQTEAKLLALKLEKVSLELSMIKKINREMLNEQIKTNVLLEQLVDNTRHYPSIGPG